MRNLKLIFITILIVVITFVGCDNNIYYWEFAQESNNVKEIQIIEAKNEYEYVIIKNLDIELVEELYAEIESIEMRRYGPSLLSPNGKCFLFVFDNGERDIISKMESKHLKYKEERLMAYNSWLKCDEEQFDELINKYLQE